MKLKSAFFAVMFSLGLGVGLVSCGGGIGASADYTANFAGTWNLESTATMVADDVTLMRDLGLQTNLYLNEDGTASLDLFGDIAEGTWAANSADTATLTISEKPVNITLAEGKLVFDQGTEDKMYFVKGEADAPATSSDVAEVGAADVNDTQAADNGAEAEAEEGEGADAEEEQSEA